MELDRRAYLAAVGRTFTCFQRRIASKMPLAALNVGATYDTGFGKVSGRAQRATGPETSSLTSYGFIEFSVHPFVKHIGLVKERMRHQPPVPHSQQPQIVSPGCQRLGDDPITDGPYLLNSQSAPGTFASPHRRESLGRDAPLSDGVLRSRLTEASLIRELSLVPQSKRRNPIRFPCSRLRIADRGRAIAD